MTINKDTIYIIKNWTGLEGEEARFSHKTESLQGTLYHFNLLNEDVGHGIGILGREKLYDFLEPKHITEFSKQVSQNYKV